MVLDPYFADKFALLDGVTDWNMEDPEAVAKITAFFAGEAWAPPVGVTVEDLQVSGPGGTVAVRMYRPERELVAPLVWLHGGGFAAGDLNMPEAHMVAGELSSRARCVVYSVDYRLATADVCYPAPVDDVAALWEWLTQQPSPFGAPAIGGASAGAAIALSSALRARDQGLTQPRAILLAYPFVHFPTPAPTFVLSDEMEHVPRLLRFTPESIEDMVRNYVGRISNLPPQAMPGAADLTGLPKTAVLISGLDDLGPSGDLLVKQLTEIGVPVTSYTAPGVPHGHLNWIPTVPEVERSLNFFAQVL